MPIDYSKYPPHWEAFSLRIRTVRAQNKCEWCQAENGHPHPITGSKVVLTVAHLDARGDVCACEILTGLKCAVDDHVVALCQRDHLSYDSSRHTFNARRTRARRRGQLWIADLEDRDGQNERDRARERVARLLDELHAARLEVVLIPSRDDDCAMRGGKIRAVQEHNAQWYREFCLRYESARRDRHRFRNKFKTAIKRRETIRGLEELIAGRCQSVYAQRLAAFIGRMDTGNIE